MFVENTFVECGCSLELNVVKAFQKRSVERKKVDVIVITTPRN